MMINGNWKNMQQTNNKILSVLEWFNTNAPSLINRLTTLMYDEKNELKMLYQQTKKNKQQQQKKNKKQKITKQ